MEVCQDRGKNAKTWFFPRLQEGGYALRLFCLAEFFQDWYLFQKVSYTQSWCLESMEAQHKWWKFLLQYNGCYLDATDICISRLSLVLKVSLPNFNLEQAVWSLFKTLEEFELESKSDLELLEFFKWRWFDSFIRTFFATIELYFKEMKIEAFQCFKRMSDNQFLATHFDLWDRILTWRFDCPSLKIHLL